MEVIIINSLNESLKRILECQSTLDMIDYLKYFSGKKLESIIDNKDELVKVLINSSLYTSFMNERRQLIQSSYITKKIIPVNTQFWRKKFKNRKQIEDYYQNMEIDCNFSFQNQCKKEILYYLQQDNQEKAKELLRQIKH